MRVKRSEEWLQEVSARLEATRRVLELTHAEMAKTAEVSPQRWGNWIAGIRPIDVEAASRLCDRHRITLDWIYRGILAGLPHDLAQKLEPRLSAKVVRLSRKR